MSSKVIMSACGLDCKGCDEYGKRCEGCPGCGVVLKKSCDCGTCIYICPRRPGAKAFMKLGLGNIEHPSIKGRFAPAFIGDVPIHLPAVADPFKKTPGAGSLPWVLINGARFFSSTGSGVRPSVSAVAGSVRQWLNVEQGSKIGIHFYVRDKFLEGFWKHRISLYPYLRQFDLVFGTNFSVYEDSPRYEHLINIRRSKIVYEEMLQEGIKVIPDIAWYQKVDLDLWTEYILTKSIKLVAVSTQTVGTGLHTLGSWKGYLAGIRYLAERLPETGIIIVGVSSAKKVTVALREVGYYRGAPVSFMSTQAFMLARKGRVFNQSDNINQEQIKRMDFDSLFLLNVADMEKSYMDIKEVGQKDAQRENRKERCNI